MLRSAHKLLLVLGTLVIAMTVALGSAGCVTSGGKKKKSAARKPGGKSITMSEVAGHGDDAGEDQATQKPSKRKRKTARKTRKAEPEDTEQAATANAAPMNLAPVPTSAAQAAAAPAEAAPGAQAAAALADAGVPTDCASLVQRFAAPYQKLAALLPPNSYVPSDQALDTVLRARPEDCADAARRDATLLAIQSVLSGHGGKVGVILPLTGPRAKLAAFVLEGLRAAFRDAGTTLEAAAILKDSGGAARTAEMRLAELVIKDRVALVLGGLEKAEADALVPWTNDLLLPALLLTRDREAIQASRYAFRIYPDEKRLAETLLAAAQRRGWRRLAVVRPSNGKSDKIVGYLKDALAATGGSVVHDVVYTAGNFESMAAVGRTLFQTEAAERRDEYRRAYQKVKQAAQQAGVPFDPRMVVLRPLVNFDAVFIPDDFRTVRHFAKLFRFHMVSSLPMIGNHEWRSPALVDPWDEFMEGSIFADFIGSYGRLPPALAAPTLGSPYFVHPQAVVPTDFRLIGWRAGRVASMALKDAATVPRRKLEGRIAALASSEPGVFGSGPVFDQARTAAWPTYLFSVTKQAVQLEAEGPGAAPVALPAAKTAITTPAAAAAAPKTKR